MEKNYRFNVDIALPNKKPYSFELSLDDDSLQSAIFNAKQLIMKEENISNEQENHIKLQLITNKR